MLAARWHGRCDVRVEEVPRPVPALGQVLVAVSLVGLCGTDLEEYRHGPVDIPVGVPHTLSGRSAPLTLGHEVVGVVVECPDGQVPVGTPVVPDVVVGCGTCWWCRRHAEGQCPRMSVRGQQDDGGFAAYMLASAATCVWLPDTLEPEVAVFAEPAAVALRALRKAGDLTGAVVCVQGAGTIGQLVAQAALAGPATAVVVVDPDEGRRQTVQARGAAVASLEQAREVVYALSAGRGADVVLECSGALTGPGTAVGLSRRGGTLVLVGLRGGDLSVPWLDVVLGERRLLGSAAHLWDEDVAAAVSMLVSGRLDPSPLPRRVIGLTDIVEQGFEWLLHQGDAPKVIVDPTGGAR